MSLRDSRYATFSKAYLSIVQSRQRAMLDLLGEQGVDWLGDKRILEVGCGSGGILAELLFLGARPHLLWGLDISADSVERAREKLCGVDLRVGDATDLPYEDDSFDLVLQYTVFSSIPQAPDRRRAADEIRRVLAPGGMVVWYDFWMNPVNRWTVGLRRRHLQALFPGCDILARRVTLAPPLARLLVPRTRLGAELLEAARLFNSHFMAVIRPPVGSRGGEDPAESASAAEAGSRPN
jgi:SAM-dependent methyltransferase